MLFLLIRTTYPDIMLGHFENIEIPPIKAKNLYMAAYGSPDGSKDPKYWVNQYISKYYGVGSVLVR